MGEKVFNSTIIKLTSICNLDCSYCYMFNLQDKTYEFVPKFMPIDTMLLFLNKLEIYLEKKNAKNFTLVLHGGEPTLWPINNYRIFFSKIKELKKNYDIRINIQTNGYKLNYDLLDLLKENDVMLGISLDGPPEINDKYRVTHTGKGSYDKVISNVNKLINNGYKNIIGGFLVVVDPFTPLESFLDWIESLPVKKIDLLWPIEFNYNQTPWDKFKIEENDYSINPIYGKWFAKLFEVWFERDDPDLYIRHFYEIIYLLFGTNIHTDTLVNDYINMFVLNTDGNLEYHDYFRAYSNGTTRTDYFIQDSLLSEIEKDKIFSQLFSLYEHLPKECTKCPQKELCGGGFIPGRMDKNEPINLLSKKSVLCHDQKYLFSEVKRIIQSKLNANNSVTREMSICS